jgi:(p)ppGpp synthase/HD superfamily hydrolase
MSIARAIRDRRLSSAFDEAVAFAIDLHRGQFRKGTNIPYVAHLFAVTSIVLEAGGSEAEAIAAMLHDAVEDQGGAQTAQEIERRFGAEVARIVLGCSDTQQVEKEPWRVRKERYLEHLREADESQLLVSLADKLHNARSLLADQRHVGDLLWDRFNASREEALWYYRALTEVFLARGNRPLALELDRAVADLESLTIASTG